MSELKNEGEGTPAEEIQPVEKPESNMDLEVQNTILEEELGKQVEEKDNYKKGLLSKEEENKKLKQQIKALTEDPLEPTTEEEPKVIEEITPVETPVEPTVPKESEGYNPEKEAKAQFIKNNPGINMTDVLANYRGSKYDTVTEYLTALEDAKEYTDYKSGKKTPTNASVMTGQGNGASEVKNIVTPKITARDIEQAKRFFGGDVNRYLKAKQLRDK